MQLLRTNKSDKFNILFNEKETKNIKALLHAPIDCRNTKLCYCIEQALPMNFNEFKIKRPMIMDIVARIQLYYFRG